MAIDERDWDAAQEIGRAAGFRAGFLAGRNAAAGMCMERAAFYRERSQETDNANLACEREYGAEACENLEGRIRALEPPGGGK